MACPSGQSASVTTRKRFLRSWKIRTSLFWSNSPRYQSGPGREFGLPVGTCRGKQVAALRRLGFDAVLDTNFSADLTIMEEATELVKRITGEVKKPFPSLPHVRRAGLSSAVFLPELIPNLSTCKSPQQMFGALAKTITPKEGIDPNKIVSVSIMPCTAKNLRPSARK